MKVYKFIVVKGGKRGIVSVKSNHLNGAVRKLYQMYDFDEIKEILD